MARMASVHVDRNKSFTGDGRSANFDNLVLEQVRALRHATPDTAPTLELLALAEDKLSMHACMHACGRGNRTRLAGARPWATGRHRYRHLDHQSYCRLGRACAGTARTSLLATATGKVHRGVAHVGHA